MQRLWGFGLLLLGLVISGGLWLAWALYHVGREDIAIATTILAFLASVVIPGVQALLQHTSHRLAVSTPEQLDAAIARLAAETLSRWTDEAGKRELHDPYPLTIRWSPASRLVADHPDVVMGVQGRPNGRRLNVSGKVENVVAAFRTLPGRRLVVIGKPGSGKTSLLVLLLLGLLKDPRPGEPVPVLFSVESWDPGREAFHRWLSNQLVEHYPWVAPEGPFGPTAAVDLVTHGRVIPLLDGLDETADESQLKALKAINRLGTDRPIVIASLDDQYDRAVRAADVLTAAAVVKIEPLRTVDIERYLRHRLAPGRTLSRWRPLLAHLKEQPTGQLAMALSTPLMVWLLGRAYADPQADPRQLLDTVRFPNHHAIENHLIDLFVRSIYSSTTGERWLRNIAHQLRVPLRPRLLRESARNAWLWWELAAYRGRPPRVMQIARWTGGLVASLIVCATLLLMAFPGVVHGELLMVVPCAQIGSGAYVGVFIIWRVDWRSVHRCLCQLRMAPVPDGTLSTRTKGRDAVAADGILGRCPSPRCSAAGRTWIRIPAWATAGSNWRWSCERWFRAHAGIHVVIEWRRSPQGHGTASAWKYPIARRLDSSAASRSATGSSIPRGALGSPTVTGSMISISG